MNSEDNGNVGFLKSTFNSTEDLSEYTDADESMSAPTELLAEFLSAVMMKEYENALKCCKLILHYEPNNATAKEFYPLILKKIQEDENAELSSENSEDSDEEPEESSSSSSESENSSDEDEDAEEVEVNLNLKNNENGSKNSSNGDNTTGSYSSLEDDAEGVIEQLAALGAKYKVDNMDFGNGNKINYESTGNYSDSESPTENVVVSQETISNLRSRVVPN